MPYLSFREYLVLAGYPDFGVHDAFGDAADWMYRVIGGLNVLKRFESYLVHGTRPMVTEGTGSYPTRAVQAGQEGNAREAFAACAVESAGMGLHAEPDEPRGDFIANDTIRLEVGGRKKGRKSADEVARDGLDVPSPGVLPVWSLGFLWRIISRRRSGPTELIHL